jgi:hypothetical protein
VTGEPITFAISMTESPASFSLAGQPETYGISLNESPGVFSFTGESVTLSATGTQVLLISPGAFILTGEADTFNVSLNETPGAFTETGIAASFAVALDVSPGAFIEIGGSVGLGASLPASVGAFALSGEPLLFGVAFQPGVATFAFTGETVAITTSQAAFQYFEQALDAKLNAIPELVAIVGSAIYVGAIPQTHDLTTNGPALTYFVPTKPRGHVLTGSDGTATARVQFDAWCIDTASGPGVGTTKKIVETIRNAIDGIPGVWGNGGCVIVSVVSQGDSDADEEPKTGTDEWLRHVIAEYSVKYRVGIPTLS